MNRFRDLSDFKLVRLFCLVILGLCVAGIAKAQSPLCPFPSPSDFIKKSVAIQPLPKGFREDVIMMWVCPTATGYRNASFVFKYTDSIPWIDRYNKGTYKASDANAACSLQCSLQFEDNLVAAMHRIQEPYRARATVAKFGTATSRPVYRVNPDGTVGAMFPNVRVAIGAPCWLDMRIPGTNYYSVQDQPNVFTPAPNDKIGPGVAQCTPSFPLPPIG